MTQDGDHIVYIFFSFPFFCPTDRINHIDGHRICSRDIDFVVKLYRLFLITILRLLGLNIFLTTFPLLLYTTGLTGYRNDGKTIQISK